MRTIKSRRDFERVFFGGRRANHRLVRMIALVDDEGGLGRVAFVAPKRLGNAVFRNRCKRVLREAARLSGLPEDMSEVILVATRATFASSPADVSRAIDTLMRRLGIRQADGVSI